MSQSRATGLPAGAPVRRAGLSAGAEQGLGGRPHRLPLKSFVLLVSRQHIPNAFSQLFGYYGTSYRPAASAFNLPIKFLYHFVVGVGGDGRLPESSSQVGVPILVAPIYARWLPPLSLAPGTSRQ
ncbi:MAG: hypothetical protein U5K69_13730 [Balneolaceae bacterium]|nr:hypothetical protein [Balneolaceae bacterium]